MGYGNLAAEGHVRQRLAQGIPAGTSLAETLIALWAAASWTLARLYLPTLESLTLGVGDRASAWASVGVDTAPATQGTDGSRPTYLDTGVNGGPCLSFDGGDTLTAPAYDASSYSAACIGVIFEDVGSGTSILLEHGKVNVAGNGSIAIVTDDGLADSVESYTRANNIARARSGGDQPFSVPGLISATGDLALATDEAEIRVDGSAVTASRPNNGNNTTTVYRNDTLTIGGREGGILACTGKIVAAWAAFGSTSIPIATLAAHEAALATEYLS